MNLNTSVNSARFTLLPYAPTSFANCNTSDHPQRILFHFGER
jgi:hypothetical protein